MQIRRCLLLVVSLSVVAGCRGPYRSTYVAPRPAAPRSAVGYAPEPERIARHHDLAVTVSPREVIAPVGSEVVLIAGVQGQDGALTTRERVEWNLEPGGAAHFVTLAPRRFFDRPFSSHSWPRKVDNTYAIGMTASRSVALTRGTLSTVDDVPVAAGQAWISVTCPVEETSHITAFAPDVYDWQRRTDTATIHWINAQWQFPPPAVNPVGSRHRFTTVVTRHTDGGPLAGWFVRYEVIDGPAAGFAPGGEPMVEVVTDELGQATVEIFQHEAARGTNTICIELIRPATSGGKRLVVGRGATSKTWTSAAIALTKTGPSQVSIGSTVTYQIEVTNPGDLPVHNVVVSDDVPQGFTLLRSTPSATAGGRQVQWQLGELGAQQTQTVEVEFRADRPGTVNNCARVTTSEGPAAQDCAATTVLVPSIEVTVGGPPTATVGDRVTFEITVMNRGEVPATGVVVVNRFDTGLQHDVATSPIERELGELAPGASQSIGVTFTATRPGELCNSVEVIADAGQQASARACVRVAASATPTTTPAPTPTPTPTPIPTPPPRPPADQTPASVSISKTGPTQLMVGQTAEFFIEITNTGTKAISGLTVVDQYDEVLEPSAASEGHTMEGSDLVWTINETIEPGRSLRLQINCHCLRPAAEACNRVVVTSATGAQAEDEACLTILAEPSSLKVSIVDLRDPVNVGRETSYEIRVTNNSAAPATNVEVSAAFPTQLMPLTAGTAGPTGFTIEGTDGQTVRFEPLARLEAGEGRSWRIQARAVASGEARVRAQARSDGLAPASGEAETTVN